MDDYEGDFIEAENDDETLDYWGEDYVDAAIDWGGEIKDKAVEVGKKLTGPAIDKFRNKITAWYKAFQRRKNDKRKRPPKLQAKHDALIRSGERIIKVIESLGIDLNQEAIEKNLGAIFVPIIAAGAAGGVLAMVAKWYYDDRSARREESIYFKAIKSGATHEQAYKVSQSVSTKPKAGEMRFSTKLILGAVALGGLYLFFNKKGDF